MNMPSSAISVRGLRKSFKDKTVLDGIDLEIEEGTIFSLLGPNGAGKPNPGYRHFFRRLPPRAAV